MSVKDDQTDKLLAKAARLIAEGITLLLASKAKLEHAERLLAESQCRIAQERDQTAERSALV